MPHQSPNVRLQSLPLRHRLTDPWQSRGVHGVLRMRPQRLRWQCFIEDEGRPLEVGLQERASNHLKLRGSRARVVSVEEKAETNSVRCALVRRTQVNH